MAELKTKENDANVDKFLNSIYDEQQREDSKELRKLMEEVTGAPGKMWGSSIIGFGSKHLKYASGRELDWMQMGFSPRKQNLTLYVTSGFGEYAAASGYDPERWLKRLGKHTTGKGCLYIKRLSDVDMKVLRELLRASLELKAD